ncbi:hypothetical protein INS49_015910 [Diaporthe citri]|uniref:uncharacterized protein n=1 Tax=Diaporthe citri TaxID=83186 RepID=UPI001C7F7B1F|nr:uncharacterized protein INS49_015910 [Diaporthe citri]KAG6356522.1 hypothetical protein INS49_015910 [Diaporthe citri]
MARTRQKQKQRQPRLELLPVELQLAILGNLASCEDLTSLTIASRSYHATYLRHRKLILSEVTQATLGDLFVDACMLHHWEHNINNYTEDEDDIESSTLLQWQSNLGSQQPTETEVETSDAVDAQPWPGGPYRHIQLKFLYDYDKLAMDDTEDQVKYMRGLLTAEDFSRILSFHAQAVRPLTTLFSEAFPVRPDDIKDNDKWNYLSQARSITLTERQRIMHTLYQFQICCRLYAPRATPEDDGFVDLGQNHRLAMARDFFSRYDMVENNEFQIVFSVVVWALRAFFRMSVDNTEWKKVLWQRYQRTGMPGWTHYHPTTLEPVGMSGVTAGAASMGLRLLMRLTLVTRADEAAAELVASDPPHLSNFVWEALMGMRDFYHFKVKWPESWTDEFWE